jgi:LysR family transcriptional regulator, hydrogen peroxide-inducible genes activator
MPSLRQLEYLVAIADTRHFRRAAEKVNTTQPTLSEQLKALEERLNAQLVERSRSRVILTPLGLQVVQIARRMLRDAQDIRDLAGSGGRELGGLLRIGIPSTIGPYLLPKVVPDLHSAYPALKLYVREELPETLPRSLEEGTHDVIVTLLPVQGAELHSVVLCREPLHLAVAADHPLACKDRVERADIEGQDVLTLAAGYQLHDVVLALCEEFGAKLRSEYEGTSLDMLREMVATGLGITFFPGLYVRRELTTDRRLKLLELEGRSLYRTIGMVWRKSTARHDHYQSLAERMRAAIAAEFATDPPSTRPIAPPASTRALAKGKL